MPMIEYRINSVHGKITTFKTHRVSDSKIPRTRFSATGNFSRPQLVLRTPRPREIPPSEVTDGETGRGRATCDTVKAVNDGERYSASLPYDVFTHS